MRQGPTKGVQRAPRPARREILIRAGIIAIRARLLDTPTADWIWARLPIYALAETCGAALQFETFAGPGVEADARSTVHPGAIAFGVQTNRVVIGFGATSRSQSEEIPLPCECNIWAMALDDVKALSLVRPGESIALLVAES